MCIATWPRAPSTVAAQALDVACMPGAVAASEVGVQSLPALTCQKARARTAASTATARTAIALMPPRAITTHTLPTPDSGQTYPVRFDLEPDTPVVRAGSPRLGPRRIRP